MNSFYDACQRVEDAELGTNDIVVTQTVMSHTLFQTPILKEFYRVSAYAANGFFLSNKFEITDTVVSMSDEAREIVASMPYLQDMHNPFQTHLVAPHVDPWSASRGDCGFTAVRGVAWRGAFIGYLEISASAQVLHDIFTVTTMDGVSAQAILPDGTALFHERDDVADYSSLENTSGMAHSCCLMARSAAGGAHPQPRPGAGHLRGDGYERVPGAPAGSPLFHMS